MENVLDLYPLKLPCLSLSQVSMIKISKCLWTLPQIKTQVKDCQRVAPFSSYHLLTEEQKNIIHSIFQKINQLKNLPTTQKSDLKFVSMQMGINIFQWFVIFDKYNKVDLVDNLQWDSIGHIDTAKTYRSLYFNGGITEDMPGRIVQLHLLCLEDCVYDYWSKFPLEERLTKFESFFSQVLQMRPPMINWWRHFVQEFSKGIPTADIAYGEDRQLSDIFHSTHTRYYQTFKYYWNKTNDQQKPWIIQNVEYLHHSILLYEGLGTGIDSLNFLVKCMIDAKNTEFCRRNSITLGRHIVDIFLQWPFQDLFLPTIIKYLDYIDPQIYYYILLVTNEQSQAQYQVLGTTRRYHNLISNLWKLTPKYLKLAMNSIIGMAVPVTEILKVHDIELIRKIFNDEDLSTVRQELLDSSRGHWTKVLGDVLLRRPEILENFMQHVLHSNAERRMFRENFRLLHTTNYLLLIDKDLGLRFITWYFDLEKEVKEMKRRLKRFSSLECKF